MKFWKITCALVFAILVALVALTTSEIRTVSVRVQSLLPSRNL